TYGDCHTGSASRQGPELREFESCRVDLDPAGPVEAETLRQIYRRYRLRLLVAPAREPVRLVPTPVAATGLVEVVVQPVVPADVVLGVTPRLVQVFDVAVVQDVVHGQQGPDSAGVVGGIVGEPLDHVGLHGVSAGVTAVQGP